MKRFFALLLAVSVCLLLNCCSFSNKNYTINLIVKGTNTEFFKSVNKGAQAAASTYHVNVQMYGPKEEKDYNEQNKYIQQAIIRKPDAIILAAADYNEVADKVESASKAHIPVIMADSDVNSNFKSAYVGTNNFELGSKLAKELCDRMDNGGKVAVVSFVKSSYPAVQREKGFCEEIEKDKRFELISIKYCNSDINKAQKQATALLKDEPELVAFAALNAQSATGVAQSLYKNDKNNVHLFAIDCMPEEAMYMEENIMDLALLQNPYQMGYYSVETAIQAIKGKEVTDRYTDIYTVDKTTMFDKLYQQLIFPL